MKLSCFVRLYVWNKNIELKGSIVKVENKIFVVDYYSLSVFFWLKNNIFISPILVTKLMTSQDFYYKYNEVV